MAWTTVAEFDDPRLDPYRRLKQTNDSARSGRFIAEGDKLARRLLESGLRVESVLVGRSCLEAFHDVLPATTSGLVVDDAWIERLVGFNFHRGVLACGVRPRGTTLDDVVPPASDALRLVVCPNVQDPENLGAIIRLARAFGVQALVLGPHCADPFSRRVQRVSMAHVYRLPIVTTDDVVGALRSLRDRHATESWGTVLAADAETVGDRPAPQRLALVFGSEGHGLPPDVVAACDRRVTIPMPADVDSLNVAATAAILLYGTRAPQA